MIKYAKLTFNINKPWAYVIVKNYYQYSGKFVRGKFNLGEGGTGTLVYGSRRKYDTAGTTFSFNNVQKIEELDEEWVVRNHFAGLL